MHSFETLRAAELYCPECRTLRPVQERLLLILPDGEISIYRCSVCGKELGTRQQKNAKRGVVDLTSG
jgi:predicted RNA-binding Zn-ribbon protein involved in translation (DUF1610 family)